MKAEEIRELWMELIGTNPSTMTLGEAHDMIKKLFYIIVGFCFAEKFNAREFKKLIKKS